MKQVRPKAIVPQVSVVVPLYNKRAYIGRCLASVQSQTATAFEAIVIDDGSTDGSAEVAERFSDPRFRVIRQPNGGEGAARNAGIREAQSELVAFLDADDEWEPGFLEAILALGEAYPAAAVLATGYRRYFRDGSVRETTIESPRRQLLVNRYFRCAAQGEFVTSSSAAVRQAVLRAVGSFRERLREGTDRDMWARIGLRYPVAFDTRILATYHAEAAGRVLDTRVGLPPFPQVVETLRSHQSLIDRLPAITRRDIARYVDYVVLNYAYVLMDLRDLQAAGRILRETPLHTVRLRLESLWLRFALRALPVRLIAALKYKPKRVVSTLKRYWYRSPLGRAIARQPAVSVCFVPAERGSRLADSRPEEARE